MSKQWHLLLVGPSVGSTITTPDGPVHFLDVGEGPTVVFQPLFGPLPGTTAWLAWGKVVELLGDRFRCVLVDFPNFGLGGPVEFNEPVHDLMVRTTVSVMDHLSIDSAPMVGFSMGGTVAIDFALAHPHRVDRLVIGSCHASTGGDPYLLAPFPSEVMRLFQECQGVTGGRDHIERLLLALVHDPELVTRGLVDAMYAWRVGEPEHADTFRRSTSTPHSNLNELASIRQEVLLLHGKFDRMVPLEQALLLMSHLRQADLRVVNECGHWIPFEVPQTVADEVARFVTG